ncbi:TPA: hypothetical protein ND465_003991 [Enterobacter hormaechei]|nr:hypothetical protein [Enterobacter hormaechei]
MNIEAASIFCLVFYISIIIYAYSKNKLFEWLFVGVIFIIGAVISSHIYLSPKDEFWDGSKPDLLVAIIFGYSLAWLPALIYPMITFISKEN